ncbi:hypothetical protein RMCBS344292_07794 [Rhizopus microsporus]|nr:hypothetical protein RMCBS344292_07794 [Rhizopus microsporus]
MEAVQTFFQDNSRNVGASTIGCICYEREHKIALVLEPKPGSTSRSHQRLEPTLDENRFVFASSLEVHSESIKEVEIRSSEENGFYHAELEEPILVANGPTAKSDDANNVQDMQAMVLGRMSIIRKFQQQEQELAENVMEFMQQSNRLSTRKNYDLQWQRWVSGCLSRAPQVNPLEYDPAKLVEFLTINKDLSPQQLNCIRSAVASVFRVIHSEKPTIASNILLQQYFQAKRRNHYKLPYSSQEVYDAQPILTMVQSWGKTNDLGLDNLQQNLILLFTIASMWRPRSDNGKLQYRDIAFKHDDQGLLLGVTLIARSPKEIDINVKTWSFRR